MLHSGIDRHKQEIVISTVDADGRPVHQARLPTTHAAIAGYFAAVPGPHRAVVESTSNWYWLHDLCSSTGVDLRLGHSRYIKAISYAKVKTDADDATTLAQLLRSDLIPEARMGNCASSYVMPSAAVLLGAIILLVIKLLVINHGGLLGRLYALLRRRRSGRRP